MFALFHFRLAEEQLSKKTVQKNRMMDLILVIPNRIRKQLPTVGNENVVQEVLWKKKNKKSKNGKETGSKDNDAANAKIYFKLDWVLDTVNGRINFLLDNDDDVYDEWNKSPKADLSATLNLELKVRNNVVFTKKCNAAIKMKTG